MITQTATIGDVAEIITGKTPSKSNEDFFGGEIPFVTPAELDKDSPVLETPKTLSELGASKVKVIPAKSVMVCCIGSLGKVGLAGRDLCTNQQINSIVFDETKVFPNYEYHSCQDSYSNTEPHRPFYNGCYC